MEYERSAVDQRTDDNSMMKKNLLLALAAISLIAGNLSAQSLLGDPPETANQRQARLISESVESSKSAILGELRHAFRLLWEYPNPQAVLDELGPRAGKLFAINTRLTAYIANELELAGDTAGLSELAAMLALIPPHEIHEDGTVTLLVEEPEE